MVKNTLLFVIITLFSAYKNKKYLQKVHLLEKNRKFVPYFADGVEKQFPCYPQMMHTNIIKTINYYAK